MYLSPDPEQDMRNWFEISREFQCTDHQGIQNVNSNMKSSNMMFEPMSTERIHVEFTSSASHIEVQSHMVEQNMLRISQGMCGLGR